MDEAFILVGSPWLKVVFGFYTCNECHLFANLAVVKFVEVASFE